MKQNKVYDRRPAEYSSVWSLTVPAAAASAAKIRKALRQWLRRITSFAGLYAVVASLGLVVLVVGLIGLHGVDTTNRQVLALEDVGRRAFFAEHANSLIYAVVMDSRGVYMSAEAAEPGEIRRRHHELSGRARRQHGGLEGAYRAGRS
jgi:hypothetical protein